MFKALSSASLQQTREKLIRKKNSIKPSATVRHPAKTVQSVVLLIESYRDMPQLNGDKLMNRGIVSNERPGISTHNSALSSQHSIRMDIVSNSMVFKG